MFELQPTSDDASAPRLVARTQLSVADFATIARALETTPVTAHKVGRVAARRSPRQQRIDTLWNGKETENVAAPNDWIVTTLTRDMQPARDRDGNTNTYVIRADRFPELYEATGEATTALGDIYRARSRVKAIFVSGGFEILAPWNEVQRAPSGYLILNGTEVYGNNVETFRATYEILG